MLQISLEPSSLFDDSQFVGRWKEARLTSLLEHDDLTILCLVSSVLPLQKASTRGFLLVDNAEARDVPISEECYREHSLWKNKLQNESCHKEPYMGNIST